MIIQHNISAMNSHRQLGINNKATSKNLEKLSSGYRINRAGDDAAGLAISEKMRGQIRGLAQAENNASNGISLIQTAEGGLNETHAILQRMRELAVQSANGTYKDEVDRENIAKEVQALKSEIDRIASSTHYNGINLLDGSMGGKKTSEANAVTNALGAALTGFTLAWTPSGTPTAEETAAAAAAKSAATSGGDTTATVIVRDSGAATGNISYALQIGDKTYYTNNGSTDLFNEAGIKVGTLAPNTAAINAGVITGIAVNGTSGLLDTFANSEDSRVAGASSQLIFQIGANGSLDQRVGLHVDNMSSGNIGDKENAKYIIGIDVSTRDDANDAIKVIDAAVNQVSGTRADLGALQNRLEHTLNNLGVTKENLQAAESSIRDVDMAKEMMEFTKNNILVQASQAMLAQANQLPQGVLQLLR